MSQHSHIIAYTVKADWQLWLPLPNTPRDDHTAPQKSEIR